MGIAVDVSSPAAVVNTAATTTTTTAAFTAPTGAYILIHIGDCSTGGTKTFTVTDTGGLTWTKKAANTTEASEIWISSITLSSVSRTVSAVQTAPPGQWGIEVIVVTGVDGTTPVGATNNGGTSTTNDLVAAAITTTANNSLVVGGDVDDAANGPITSSDTVIACNPTSGNNALVYKAAVTATSGTAVTLDFNAGGAGAAAHRWVALELLASGAGPAAPVAHSFVRSAAVSTASLH